MARPIAEPSSTSRAEWTPSIILDSEITAGIMNTGSHLLFLPVTIHREVKPANAVAACPDGIDASRGQYGLHVTNSVMHGTHSLGTPINPLSAITTRNVRTSEGTSRNRSSLALEPPMLPVLNAI